jgi:murein DD-endopeptidase MepM/ murein hydrolase activator NlpD
MGVMKHMGTKHDMKNMVIGALACFILTSGNSLSSASDPSDFQEPLEDLTLSGRNDYGTYNLVKPNLFHGGMDVRSANYNPADFNTPVMASQSGIVHKVFGLDNEKINLFRCGAGWGSSPYYDSDGHFYDSHQNQGFGMTVIIKHGDSLFTLYAHLNCIEPGIVPGREVAKGEKIGIMGNSAYEYRYCPSGECGAAKGFEAHLHFEVKANGVLCDKTDSGPNYAYVSQPPEYFGYHDPILYLNNSSVNPVNPFPVRVSRAALLRPGPGAGYGRLTALYSPAADLLPSSEFVAYRSARMPSDECESGLWYQIFLPCLNTIGDCEGWICADSVSASSRPMLEVAKANPDLNITAGPSHDAKVIAKAYNGQKFVYLETRESLSGCGRPWYSISMPNGINERSGWVCGDDLRILDGLPDR